METAKANHNKKSLRAHIAVIVTAMLASLLAVTAPAGAITAQARGFIDVPTSRSDYAAIVWMADRGITTGVRDGNYFAPDRTVTRGEFAAFLWRYAERPAAPTSCGFQDIPSNSYTAQPACWMKATGLTKGINKAGTLFGPGRTITRAEAVAMLWRYIGEPASTIPHGFSDIPANAYYEPAVKWFKEYGLTSGTSATTFSPNRNITRGQSALFLYRYNQSQVGSSSPGEATVDGVIGSSVGSWSFRTEPTLREILQPEMRRSVPVPTFGGVFELNISEPADAPVDTMTIGFPAYLPDAHTNGTVIAVPSGECAGSPTVTRNLQQAVIERFYCSDGDADGRIDGVMTVHLSDFAHTVRTPGPRGGFAITYGTADNVRRPTSGLVAQFRADTMYGKWGEPNLDMLGWQYPAATRSFTEMYNNLPNRLGTGSTGIHVNNPASAPVNGVAIRFNNETSDLGLTFDNTAAFDERDSMAPWALDSVSRDPSTSGYRTINWLMVNGECSSDPAAYPFPATVWTPWENMNANEEGWRLPHHVWGYEDTLHAEGFECKDHNGDGRINGAIAVNFQYLLGDARSFPRPYGKTLCADPTLKSVSVGCIDPDDIRHLYGNDAATVNLISNGAEVPVPFADTELMSQIGGDLAQYCSNDPLGCFPAQDYPSFMTKDINGVYTCLLYPYLCWPEGNWPTEYQQDISRTCAVFPERCRGAESERPKTVMPWYGVDPYKVAATAATAQETLPNPARTPTG
jgi:hypothetical protein